VDSFVGTIHAIQQRLDNNLMSHLMISSSDKRATEMKKTSAFHFDVLSSSFNEKRAQRYGSPGNFRKMTPRKSFDRLHIAIRFHSFIRNFSVNDSWKQ